MPCFASGASANNVEGKNRGIDSYLSLLASAGLAAFWLACIGWCAWKAVPYVVSLFTDVTHGQTQLAKMLLRLKQLLQVSASYSTTTTLYIARDGIVTWAARRATRTKKSLPPAPSPTAWLKARQMHTEGVGAGRKCVYHPRRDAKTRAGTA